MLARAIHTGHWGRDMCGDSVVSVRSARAWLLGAGLVLMCAVALSCAQTAQAAARASSSRPAPADSCSTYWVSETGSWTDPSNWSNGVPSESCDAVITEPGTYTVTLPAGSQAYAASLTLGGSSGTQTLELLADDDCKGALNDNLNLENGGTVDANGFIEMTQTGNCGGGAPQLAVLGGTLTNDGTIQIDQGPNQTGASVIPAQLAGQIVNAATINVDFNTYFGGFGLNPGEAYSLDNDGTINLNDGSVFSGNTVTVTDDAGGVITNHGGGGHLLLEYGGVYNQGNGTTSPDTLNPSNPAVLLNGANLAYTGTGASSVVFQGADDLSGDLAADQNLTAQGDCSGAANATLVVGASLTNAGDIELTQTGACTSGAQLEVTAGTLTNAGTIESDPGPGATSSAFAQMDGQIVNTGEITANLPINFGPAIGGSTLDNDGTISIPAGSALNNDGTISLGSSSVLALGVASASSYGQIAGGGTDALGGTLSVDRASSYTPSVGDKQNIVTAGSLSGTFAHTLGGNGAGFYTVVYSSTAATLVTEPASSTPSNPSNPSNPSAPKAPKVSKVSSKDGKLVITLSCPAGGAACAKASFVARVTEHLKGTKLTAVTARSKKSKPRTKTVVIASTSVSLAAGASKTITVKLNATGHKLLEKFRRLKADYAVTITGATVKTGTVTITLPKTKKHHHKKK